MKKLMFLCAFIALLAGVVSCEEPEKGYTGTNYIYLTAESNSMYDNDDASIEVTAMLTAALDENLLLSFTSDDKDGIITLDGNPVTIAAGEKSATFTVKTAGLPEFTNSMDFKVTLDESTVLPEKVVLKEAFAFTVHSSDVPEMTEEQKTIVEAYQKATGIDLTKYLGLVSVTTVYTASSPDSETPLAPKTLKGSTKIVLSEESTADKPVLKMTVNPMGLTDVLYAKLRSNTVLNPDWINASEDSGTMCYKELLETIGWTAEGSETFSMSLDGIELASDKSVVFAREQSCIDQYGDEVDMFKVHFDFTFSAYDREVSALAQGTIGAVADPDWLYDATVSPDFYLNCEDVSEDGYECGNYTESSAVISGDKLEFTFCIYNNNDYDYTKVVATYTPNK